MDNIYFFDKLPNYVQYFGSNIVGGVAESWVEAEISWVEVDGTGWSWVKVDGAGWSWVHGLVIPVLKRNELQHASYLNKIIITNFTIALFFARITLSKLLHIFFDSYSANTKIINLTILKTNVII